MSLALKFGPWVLLVVMTLLYLDKRDDLAAAIEQCNVDKLQSVVEAQDATRDALQAAHTRELAERDQRAAEAETELENARVAEKTAKEGTAEAEQRNRELQLEVFNAQEIPDSSECLNVFVPGGMLHTAGCTQAGDSGGAGADPVCEDPSATAEADSAFSNITYSDALILWGRDRDTIQILNGQLEAIESLND